MKERSVYKMREKVIAVVCIVLFISAAINIDVSSYSLYPEVKTINSNVLTNETVNIVGNTSLMYSGSPYTVTNATEFKAALDEAISGCAASVTISYTGSTSLGSFSTILNSYVKDVLQTAGHDYEKTLLYKWSVSYTNTTPQFSATYSFSYLETAEQRNQVTAKVNEVLASILTTGMTDEQKEKVIHDYIVKTIAYDKTLVNHSAYAGLFGLQQTVCQGYALLAYKMFTAAGLEARIVTGKANNIGHAWNYVKLNGVWYQIDVTWDDPVPDVAGRIRYDYFNLTDTQMASRAHIWTPAFYPTANTPYTTTDAEILSGGASANVLTPQLDSSKVTVVNNMTGKVDTISIVGLSSGQTVKVFKSVDSSTPLLKKIIPLNTTGAAFTYTQLGVSAGSIYVSVTGVNQTESNRTKVDYLDEPKTNAPTGLIATNNVDSTFNDTIVITQAMPKAMLKAYADVDKKLTLGSATVTEGGIAIIKLSSTRFATEGGTVYVTLKENGMHESLPSSVAYDAEITTATPTAISVHNFTSISDVLNVKGLKVGDTIKAYDAEIGGRVLATGKVKSGKTSTATIVRLNENGGTIWVTVKSINQKESVRVKIDYQKED